MSLRIFHTADNHIGISFHRYPEVARKRQIAERFASLERLVTTANERKADFFMVEGDLFDKTSVTRAQVGRTVQILGKLEGEAVLVLAGNHDFSEGSDSKLWMQFRAAADGSRALALTEPGVTDFEADDYRVRFHVINPTGKPSHWDYGWATQVAATIRCAELLPNRSGLFCISRPHNTAN